MGDTVILAICFPLIIVGMVLVLMWGMGIVGSHRNGHGQEEGKRIHPGEVCENGDSRWGMVEKSKREHASASRNRGWV